MSEAWKSSGDDYIPTMTIYIAVKQEEVGGRRGYSLFSISDTEIAACPEAQVTADKLVDLLKTIEDEINQKAFLWFLGGLGYFGTVTVVTVELFNLDGTESVKLEGLYPILSGTDCSLVMSDSAIHACLNKLNDRELQKESAN